MISNPFSQLHKNAPWCRVGFFTKADTVITDQSVTSALGGQDYASLYQEHGNRTLIIRSPLRRTEKADGMITDQPGLVLTIRSADCQTFVIVAPKQHVMGILHAGWRGLVAKAIPEFFTLLHKEFSVSPSDVYVGSGPSLCIPCADFTDPHTELIGIPQNLVHGKNADLRAWADQQFDDAGVAAAHRERDDRCTRCNPETFWTYRGGDRNEVIAGKTNVLACVME